MATAAGKSNTASTRDSTRADYSSDDPAFEHNALNIPLCRCLNNFFWSTKIPQKRQFCLKSKSVALNRMFLCEVRNVDLSCR